MYPIVINIVVFTFVGAFAGLLIKFMQWCLADLFLGFIIELPTVESVVKLVVILAMIGAVCGLINGITIAYKEKKEEKIWTCTNNTQICYRVQPPNFRNIPDELGLEFETCGFCKHYSFGKGCEKYGVKYEGDGSVVKTVCDDFDSSLKS